LREQVTVDQGRITALSARHADAPKGATLVVTWASKGGNDYRHDYVTMSECRRAADAVISQEQARRDAADAEQERTMAASGWVVAHGGLGVTADCLPL
jgi:hypothetical protein